MGGINWSELFPTRTSALIFVAYMLLFVNHGILVTASQGSKNDYNYNTVIVVLLTEVLKLVFSVALYCKDDNISTLIADVIKNTKLLALYLIPAFLYCLYNNLTYTNLATFDPTTYSLLLQLRVVLTGVLFQFVFKKNLSTIQWFSLILLMLGCMVKQVDFGWGDESASAAQVHKNTKGLDLSINAVFILAQILCSCLAGVYNEHLLKREGMGVNIFVQNVFMYVDSIICNVAVLLVQGDISGAVNMDSLSVVFHYKVAVIMINNAVAGIVTSFFLKSLNSIVKTFASALELIIIAVMCYILFSIPIQLNTILAIAIVLYAIILYSRNPVNNISPPSTKSSDDEQLLKEIV